MMTVNRVSKLSGVSVRTLHYYDEIGLLTPALTTDAGYRMYDETNLFRLQQILLFKELEFSLKDIKKIIDSPDFDINEVLSEQIKLLTLKKQHLTDLISFAKRVKSKGGSIMNFEVFNNEKYKAEVKEKWGNTNEFCEYEKKTADYSFEKQKLLANEMMNIFKEFGDKKEISPSDGDVLSLVKKLQDFISANYYTCSKNILAQLGEMYDAGGEMTDNIDAAGGKGTAKFAAKAIERYCK